MGGAGNILERPVVGHGFMARGPENGFQTKSTLNLANYL